MSSKSSSWSRLLVAVYAVFAVSASARASYQIFRSFDEAPIAYSLSAFSAAIYIVATIALARRSRHARTVALVTVSIELLGVLVVGLLSITHPALFAHPSVWSQFGLGYGLVPLALPIIGLWWLLRSSK